MPDKAGFLDFRAADGIGFAAERGRLDEISPLFQLKAERIGPLLEVVHLQNEDLQTRNLPWLDAGMLTGLRAAVIDRRSNWSGTGGSIVGMIKLAVEPVSNEWTRFAMEAKRAAVTIGFDVDWAAQMIAAIRELEDNVREHAGETEGAYLAYRASPGAFEFVVADHGRGVLATLSDAPGYEDLSSDGEALGAALTDGVSRFGNSTGRGFGYRPLFRGLVNRRATIRVRTGTGSLTIDGLTPTLPSAQIGMKPRVSGLFISVSCLLQ